MIMSREIAQDLAACDRLIEECNREIRGLTDKIETLKKLKSKILVAYDEMEYIQRENAICVNRIEELPHNLNCTYGYCDEHRSFLFGQVFVAFQMDSENTIKEIDERIWKYENRIDCLYGDISRIANQMDDIKIQIRETEI